MISPLLFLVFIGDLDANINDAAVKVLKYVDDSKLLMNITNEEDVYSSQLIVDDVYRWADENNMKWNRNKFQLLRVGSNNFLQENTMYFSPEYENIIKSWEYVKDLGLFIDKDLSFKH